MLFVFSLFSAVAAQRKYYATVYSNPSCSAANVTQEPSSFTSDDNCVSFSANIFATIRMEVSGSSVNYQGCGMLCGTCTGRRVSTSMGLCSQMPLEVTTIPWYVVFSNDDTSTTFDYKVFNNQNCKSQDYAVTVQSQQCSAVNATGQYISILALPNSQLGFSFKCSSDCSACQENVFRSDLCYTNSDSTSFIINRHGGPSPPSPGGKFPVWVIIILAIGVIGGIAAVVSVIWYRRKKSYVPVN